MTMTTGTTRTGRLADRGRMGDAGTDRVTATHDAMPLTGGDINKIPPGPGGSGRLRAGACRHLRDHRLPALAGYEMSPDSVLLRGTAESVRRASGLAGPSAVNVSADRGCYVPLVDMIRCRR